MRFAHYLSVLKVNSIKCFPMNLFYKPGDVEQKWGVENMAQRLHYKEAGGIVVNSRKTSIRAFPKYDGTLK